MESIYPELSSEIVTSNNTPKCSFCKKDPFTPDCPTCQNLFKYKNRMEKKNIVLQEEEEESKFPGPALIKRDEIYGNYVVASRRIEAGELICIERPLLVAPYGPSDTVPLCLSCYKDVAFSAKCLLCQWPVCDINCQMNLCHQENECEIFMRNGLKPKHVVNEYFSVETLRCLLLREKFQSKWQAVMKFENHSKFRKGNFMAQQTLQFITKFIREQCMLIQFNKEIIDHVVGVLSVNTFWAFKDLNRYASLLFDKVTLFAHDCDPNTRRELIRLPENELIADVNDNLVKASDYYGNSEIGIQIHASRTIESGEMITIRYVDINQPREIRRQELKEIFYFDCSCNKCLRELFQQQSIHSAYQDYHDDLFNNKDFRNKRTF